MTDVEDREFPQGDDAFPSDATEHPVKRVQAKPFGRDKAAALMLKEEALRKLTRQECFERGYITVKDLDDEELVRGKCRDLSGHIPRTGAKTEMVPLHLYDAMVAEHELRYKQKLRENLDGALNVMTGIMLDDTVEPRDRFEAAKYIFERTAGKTPETVNITVKQAPWEGVMNDITGIGAISREEHRKLKEAGPAGIIDVEIVDEDGVQPEDIPQDGEGSAESDVVPVHQPRPDEQDSEPQQAETVGQEPNVRKYVDGEPVFDRDPARPVEDTPSPEVVPPPEMSYGSRRTEAKSYADQARAAADLANRRKEAKARIRDATKNRKIARAMGADAIETEITGATVGEDGKLTFDAE